MAEFATPKKVTRVSALKSKAAAEENFVNIPPSPLLRKLGYGTGATVYKLIRSPMANKAQSPWAIKKLIKNIRNQKDLDSRLCKEAEILKQLSHPNIVGFRGFIKSPDGRNCLAMEDCNTSLGDLIEVEFDKNNPPFAPAKIVKVCSDIAQALNYLHNTALLLHCDIKSYNILVKGDFDVCKLCDFGVCMPLKKDGTLNRVEAGKKTEYVGTLVWMPKEVLQENPVITSKADIFSYGLVIWEMIALQPPHVKKEESVIEISDSSFETSMESGCDESDLELEREEGKRPPLPPVELGEGYNEVLQLFYCCTEEDIGERPSAEDLCMILEEIKETMSLEN